jgi:DNA-binding CsgD family transcriptional regulator
MPYLTEQELTNRFKFYTLELESLLEKGEEFLNVGEQVPFGIHKNDATTLRILDYNEISLNYSGYSKEKLDDMRTEYFEKHMHPYFRDVIAKQILKQVRLNPGKVVGFAQYLHLYGDETEFKPLLTFTKLSKSDPNSVFCIDLIPSLCSKVPQRIERVIEMDEFKLKHFKQFQQLTEREKEILALLTEGLNNPSIADRLFISRRTVETHRKNINRKLEIKHYREVVKYALAFDLVKI